MSNGAPVCDLPDQGQFPARQPGTPFPAIPRAQDLPSAIQAINQLSLIIQQLILPVPPTFNNLRPTTNISLNPVSLNLNLKDLFNKVRFQEVKRITEIVKIVNPQNPDNWVLVRRINQLIMQDKLTGDLWGFKR